MASILVPEYYQKFSCIGPACESTCCREWAITVDEDYYNAAKRQKDGGPLETFAASMKRFRSGPLRSKHLYAQVTLTEDKSCPVYEDGLCAIHKKYGEEKLVELCRLYPRSFSQLGENTQGALSLSCPEAARKCLLEREPMSFLFIEGEHGKNVTDWSVARAGAASLFAYELCSFSIDVLQERRFSLEQRVLLLGMFLKKTMDFRNVQALMREIEIFRTQMENVSASEFENVAPQPEIRLEWLTHIMNNTIRYAGKIERYMQLILPSMHALGQIDNQPDILARYEQAVTLCNDRYLNENSHVLENLLVNEVFRECLPAVGRSAWSGYLLIAGLLALAKYHLAAATALKGEMNDELAIETLHLLCRAYLHNRGFITGLTDIMTQQGWDDLAHVAIFLKD